MAEDVARLSFLRTGYLTFAPVYLQVKSSHLPFFAWHLRAMRDLRWYPGLEMSDLSDNALVVSQPAGAREGKPINLPTSFTWQQLYRNTALAAYRPGRRGPTSALDTLSREARRFGKEHRPGKKSNYG